MKFRIAEQCLSCSSTARKKVFSYEGFESKEFTAFKCSNCDLLYASPQPIINGESLNEIYNGEYYQNYFGEDNDYTDETSQRNKILANRLGKEFDYYSSFVDDLTPNKRVLDIGCGDGRFSEYFVKIGWDCFGIEPSSFVAKLAKQRNITILDTHVLDLDGKDKFDFIFMDNVIEHVDFPHKYMEKAFSLLNPSGVFVLKTPNSDGLIERTETFILSLLSQKLGNWLMGTLKNLMNIGSGKVHRYGNLHPPVHLSIFNKESMTKGLTNAGFKAKDVTVISGSEYFHRWKVDRPAPKGVFQKIMKLMKHIGDSTGKGEMLVTIAKKS